MFTGFDWFAASIFLLSGGNADRAERFLVRFGCTLGSCFIWPRRNRISCSEIGVNWSVVCHHVEHIVELELPNVYSTLTMSGYSPARIAQHWTRQCFYNYVNWPSICDFIALCCVLGPDYVVYTCVAALKHLAPELEYQLQRKNVVLFLLEQPLDDNFRLADCMDFMKHLSENYREMILADMKTASVE